MTKLRLIPFLLMTLIGIGLIGSPSSVQAGWKTKIAIAAAVKAAPHAIKAATPALKKKSMDLIVSTIRKHPEALPRVEQKVLSFIRERPDLKNQGLRLLEQIRPRSALPSARTASQWRSMPGKVSGKARRHIKDGEKWLKGTHGNAGSVPGQVADKLRGRSFSSFNEFRGAFWRAVGDDPVLSKGWSRGNVARMQKGKAPRASSRQSNGGSGSYELHHKTPIQRGGGVYDLDNIQVLTPRMHREILNRGYHYGG